MGDCVAVGVAAVATAVLPLHPRRSANSSPHVSRMTRIMTTTSSGLFNSDFMQRVDGNVWLKKIRKRVDLGVLGSQDQQQHRSDRCHSCMVAEQE